ncbi:MAG: ABC transporter permease [Clostridiales bacterium]|nr:ABC transporter permease [Clostridiales bacterium]
MMFKNTTETQGPWRLAITRFKKSPIAIAGALLLFVIVMATIIGPMLSPYPLQYFSVVDRFKSPSLIHPFGTDRYGQDMFIRVLYGGRITLIMAMYSATITILVGTIVGAISGYNGKWTDKLLMRFTEFIHVMPLLPLLISFTAVFAFKLEPLERMLVVMGLYGFLNFPSLARIIRGQIIVYKNTEFMSAAELLGLSKTSKIFKHLLPNVFGVIIASSATVIANAILIELMLSFVGMGFPETIPTWGNLIPNIRGANMVNNSYYWMWFFPVTLISLTVISINLMGEGLRSALDPKEEGR